MEVIAEVGDFVTVKSSSSNNIITSGQVESVSNDSIIIETENKKLRLQTLKDVILEVKKCRKNRIKGILKDL